MVRTITRDASLPAFEIQKELFSAIERLPIKTFYLRESGIGARYYFIREVKGLRQ